MRYCGFRYGKPLVLDMMEVDMFDTVSDRFDEIQKGLMDQIMDRSIVKEEKCVVVFFLSRGFVNYYVGLYRIVYTLSVGSKDSPAGVCVSATRSYYDRPTGQPTTRTSSMTGDCRDSVSSS